MAIIVRAYGLLDPLDWGDDCEQELIRMNRFWANLVEIEAQHRRKIGEAASSDPEVAQLEQQIAKIFPEVSRLSQMKNDLRKKARRKIATPEIDEPLSVLRNEMRQLAAQIKEKRAQWRARNKQVIKDIDAERYEAVKTARQNSGLWWGNYNAVCAAYETARQMAIRQGSELQYRGYNGDGRITNQIQGGLSVERLFEGSHSQVSVAPLPEAAFTHPSRGERRRLQRTTLTATIFVGEQGRRYVTWPMVMHRPIPEEATIKQVIVTKRRLGAKWRWRVSFVCSEPDEEITERPDGVCGIDFGWRKTKEGLRVATIFDGQEVRYITLPQTWMDRMEHVNALRSQLDTELNEIASWLQRQNLFDLPKELQSIIPRWRKNRPPRSTHIAHFAIVLRDHPQYRHRLQVPLEKWRQGDRIKREEMVNLRDKLMAQRTDIYRKEARVIAQQYGRIGIEDFDLRATMRVNDQSLPPTVRNNRQLANVSDLRRWIGLQAAKSGAHLVMVGGKTTTVCHHCGHDNNPEDRGDLYWVCSKCSKVWDQDDNAARNIRAVVLGEIANENLRLVEPKVARKPLKKKKATTSEINTE